jgi:hypothetical protein
MARLISFLLMSLRKTDARSIFRMQRLLQEKGIDVPLQRIEAQWMALPHDGITWVKFESKVGSMDRLDSIVEFNQLCTASLIGILDEIHSREDIAIALERHRARRLQQIKDAGGEGYDPQVVQKLVHEAIRLAYRRRRKPVLLRELASKTSAGERELSVIRLFHQEYIDVDGTTTPTRIVLNSTQRSSYLTPRQVLIVLAIGLPLAGVYVWYQNERFTDRMDKIEESRSQAAARSAKEMQRQEGALEAAVQTYALDPSAANQREMDQRQQDLLNAAKRSATGR